MINAILMIKAWMVCLGLEPGASGWLAQMNPLTYIGTPKQRNDSLEKVKAFT